MWMCVHFTYWIFPVHLTAQFFRLLSQPWMLELSFWQWKGFRNMIKNAWRRHRDKLGVRTSWKQSNYETSLVPEQSLHIPVLLRNLLATMSEFSNVSLGAPHVAGLSLVDGQVREPPHRPPKGVTPRPGPPSFLSFRKPWKVTKGEKENATHSLKHLKVTGEDQLLLWQNTQNQDRPLPSS